MRRPIMVAAGGTGGHVCPALAMADHAARLGHPVILLTDARGARFVPQDVDCLSHQILLAPWSLSHTPLIIRQLHSAFRQWQPCAIWGFGGSMTVLPLLMASWYGLSTAIHQSDSITGRANAVLSRFVHHRFSAFPMTHKGRQTVWTPVGMPIRCTFQPLPPHKNVSLPLRILIVGGSQGAHFWTLLWPRALALLSPQSRACLEVRHQCPASDLAMLRTSYEQSGLQASQWDVSSFFHHMPDQLEWAHVVFARSGASTLAELAVACRPVFLVPYPQATQNHQWHNATLHLANHPGWIMNQEALSAEVLAGLLQDWIDDTQKLCHANEYSSSPFCPLLSCDHMYQIVCGSMSK